MDLQKSDGEKILWQLSKGSQTLWDAADGKWKARSGARLFHRAKETVLLSDFVDLCQDIWNGTAFAARGGNDEQVLRLRQKWVDAQHELIILINNYRMRALKGSAQ